MQRVGDGCSSKVKVVWKWKQRRWISDADRRRKAQRDEESSEAMQVGGDRLQEVENGPGGAGAAVAAAVCSFDLKSRMAG